MRKRGNCAYLLLSLSSFHLELIHFFTAPSPHYNPFIFANQFRFYQEYLEEGGLKLKYKLTNQLTFSIWVQ